MKSLSTLIFAGSATFLLVWFFASVAMRITGVPRGFPPFTALPLLAGVVGGYVGSCVVYAVVQATAAKPENTFVFIAFAVLVLSFGLPLRLSFTHSARFAGATPAAQMTLALLHTLIAVSVVTVLTGKGANPR